MLSSTKTAHRSPYRSKLPQAQTQDNIYTEAPTQVEFVYPPQRTLMSATDPESVITYANAAFRNTCGFGNNDMRGYYHNIIRHPDMPKAAFADLWKTIESGDTWTGLVKNKRINGDHYWVRANIAPIKHGNTITSYVSVRTQPTRDEITQAEALYARVRNGQADNLAFMKGLVVKKGFFSLSRLRKSLSVRTCLRLAMATLLISVTGAAYWAAGMQGLILGALPFSILVFLIGFFLEKRIASPLECILAHAKKVATGATEDEIHFDRVDEIGMIARSLNQTGLNLRALVEDVATQTEGLQVAFRQIVAGNHELHERTVQTSQALEQTTEVTESMNQTLQASATQTAKAYELASNTFEAAEAGSQMVRSVVDTMQEIAQAAERISDINSVIDGIAFQTNLLALNAAVEAARAGEVGRGFAVVANEVRNLALRSAQAAQTIRTLVDDSVNKSRAGEKLALSAGAAMNNIVSEIHQVSELVENISEGTRAQSFSSEHVNKAMARIGSMTEKNAAFVGDLSSAGDELQLRMESLDQVVQLFNGKTPLQLPDPTGQEQE